MKATVRDSEMLHSLRPLELAQYLRVNGWQESQQIPDKASYWVKTSSGEELEILLPLRTDFADYAPRMAEVLRTLEVAENRSQLDILRDLNTANADVVRVRTHLDMDNGSIPIDDGVQLYQRTRDLIVAAACAVRAPKPVLPKRKPDQVMDYVRNVRFGQPERGSYVLTVVSPVPPSLAPVVGDQAMTEGDEPFAREAIVTLASALEAARSAAQRSAVTGNMDPFQKAVSKGVSANLCEAIIGLNQGGGDTGVEVSFFWSRSRRAPQDVPGRVFLSTDSMPFLAEAARLFKAAGSTEEIELEGFVRTLDRAENAQSGRVTIYTQIEDRWRRVQITLPDPDYRLAIQAHDRQIPVCCTGNLERDGNTLVLRNPRDFALIVESD